MPLSTNTPKFTLEELLHSSQCILDIVPDGVLSYRLLREVLRIQPDDPELVRVNQAIVNNKWIRQLKEAQLSNGSWGRFHSQDTKVKTVFHTTEEAIDRAFALGIDPNDPILSFVRQYILNVLHGDLQITDRDEKNETWPLVIKLILAGRLAQVDSTNKELDSFWKYLVDVATQAFKSRNYLLVDEVAAFRQLSEIHVPQGFLESQHALWILSSRRLPEQLDRAIVNWVWQKPDGIRYIQAPLADPNPRRIGYWLRSMNILSRFSSWREYSLRILNYLWELREEEGLWDFGSKIARCPEFPLSDNWHQDRNRKLDYSTCILVLLRKFFD